MWDQKTLQQQQLLGHPEEPLVCVSISLDDAYVVVGGAKGGVYSWDTDTCVEYRQYDDGHQGGAVQVAMCYPMEDGSHVIISCGGTDHSIVAWDLETAGGGCSWDLETAGGGAAGMRFSVPDDG